MKTSEKAVIIASAMGLSVGVGALAGAISADLWISPRIDRLADLVSHATSTSVNATTTTPVVIVPLENRPILPSYPQSLLERHGSPVAALAKHVRGAAEETPLAQDKLLGTSVALTSDGWMLSTDAALASSKIADIGLVKDGRIRSIQKGFRDTSTGLVFLKADVSGLPSVSFVRSSEVSAGAAVWVETSPGVLMPDVIANAAWQPTAAIASERVGRRFVLSAKNYPAGSTVWDSAGRLIGLVETANQSLVIPASSAGDFLAGILSSKGLERASLGLKTIDLSDAVFDTTSTLPIAGAWVRNKGAAAGSKELLDGDVIERIERDILDGTADLGEHLLDYRPGAEVVLSVWRKGTVIQVQAKLGTFNPAEALK